MSQVPPQHYSSAPYYQPPPLPPTQAKPWYQRRWVQLVSVGVIGLGVGVSATGGSDVTSDPEYQTLASQLEDAEANLTSAEEDRDTAQAELKTVEGDLPRREADLRRAQRAATKFDRKLDRRQTALGDAETAVLAREEAVGSIEDRIAANTVAGEGIYEVGSDMQPGTYRNKGSADCYYAILNSPNTDDIVNNNIGSGPQITSVSDGQYFETSGCGDWTLQQ